MPARALRAGDDARHIWPVDFAKFRRLHFVPPGAVLQRAAGASPHRLAALQAGLRVGEVAALRVSDVSLHGRSGAVRVSAHTLRHTFALGYLRDNPGKLVELADLLAHDSLDTTAVYTRPSGDGLAADGRLEAKGEQPCLSSRSTHAIPRS
jgi:integrase